MRIWTERFAFGEGFATEFEAPLSPHPCFLVYDWLVEVSGPEGSLRWIR